MLHLHGSVFDSGAEGVKYKYTVQRESSKTLRRFVKLRYTDKVPEPRLEGYTLTDFTLALDIYGTLVNPLEMDEHLKEFAGDEASEVSALWRQKQLEYTFRRGLMGSYEDFGVVNGQALEYASSHFHLGLSEDQHSHLMAEYQNLRAFEDVAPGLKKLREAGLHVFAFSNGLEKTTRELLENAGISGLLEDVVSVDDVLTFKPAPAVYEHLCHKLGLDAESVCLVSSNPFDVIGAGNFGLKTAWIQRQRDIVFDPWGSQPDFIAGDLKELASKLTNKAD